MKTLILFNTRTGTTQQYAYWLKEEFPEFDIKNVKETTPNDLKEYDRYIICSQTEGANIMVREYMIENWNVLNDKPIYLLVTGLFPEKHFESKMAFNQIPQEIREKISGYSKVPGQLDNENLKKSEKFVLHLFGADIDSKISKDHLLKAIKHIKSKPFA